VAVAVADPIEDDAPAPADAVPLQVAAEGVEATISITFGPGLSAERLQPALEAVQSVLRGRPGPLPAMVSIEGVPWRVKLPEQVAWDEQIDESLRRAAGVPIRVELG
jgi:hypothetical protein